MMDLGERRLDGGLRNVQHPALPRNVEWTDRQCSILRELAAMAINVNMLGLDQRGWPVVEVEDMSGVRFWAIGAENGEDGFPDMPIAQPNDLELDSMPQNQREIRWLFPRRGMTRRTI